MRYVDEYRTEEHAGRFVAAIAARTTRPWTLMEICGGQTHTLLKFGIDRLLPEAITLVHGPGCPVCVTPVEMIDRAIAIARRPEVIFTSFGDMLRVPGTSDDLLRVKAAGGDVRIVYSPLDAVELARRHPEREVVFFAVGFETTAPANAAAVRQAKTLGLKNFSILCAHVLVPPAMEAILGGPGQRRPGVPRRGARLHRHGLHRVRADRREVPHSDRGHRIRAARPAAGDLHDGRRPRGRALRGREPVRPHRDAGGEPAGRGDAARGLRGLRPAVARGRHDPGERLPPAPGLRGVRRRPSVSTSPSSRRARIPSASPG